MNIRPKTVRRLVILLAVCGLIAASAATVLYFSRKSKERQIQAARTEGMEAFQAGDYPRALDRLKTYVGKHQDDDFEAIYTYAVSRYRVETSNGRHLVEAKQIFEQLHNQKPDDMRVSHNLLELYNQIGYIAEATRIADEVLTRDPKDVEALRIKALSASRSGKLGEALTISQKLNEAAPLDLEGHIQTLNLLRQQKYPPAEIVSRYAALQQSHPDDPRFEMLLGLAYFSAQDQPNTLKWLRSAAKRTPPDAAFVQRLSRYFDDLKLFNESRDLLERAASSGNNPEIVKVLVQRLWQNGRFQEVVDRLKDLDAASASADADLLAFKALSLQQLDKSADAAAIVDALKKRANNNKAAAWATALATRSNAALAQRDAIKQYETAVARDRDNAVIRCWIGEAYSRLGEIELAMQHWRQAAELMPSWAHPCVLLARAQLVVGQPDEAMKYAADALRRAPNLVESGVIMAVASYRHLQLNPNPTDTTRLLGFVSEIQRGMPNEPETLPILAALQAKSAKRDEAIGTIRSAIAPDRKPDADLLLKLLEVSHDNSLGLDQEILARLPDLSTSPRLALQRALDLAKAGQKPQGLELLTKSAAGAKDQAIQWKIAIAQYREATADPAAKAGWIALGDGYPDDIAVQNVVLKSARSAVSDREFFARTIERVRKLAGEESLGWKLARARYLLTSDNKERDSAEAAGILREQLVSQSPDTAEYRVLLAAALMNLGNTRGAIEHLKAVVDRDPSATDTMLDLARLLQSQGQLDEARGYLDRAARSSGLTPVNRKPLAVMLAQQGQIQQAVNLLKPVEADLDPEAQLILAELLRKRGAPGEAEAIYTRLLNNPGVSAEALASAADFYASTDRLDQGRQILSRLSDQRFAPIQRAQLMARFSEMHVSKEAARDQLVALTNEAPNDPDAWRALIEFYIRENRFDDAMQAADNALKHLPNNEALATLKAQASALKSTKAGQSDLRPLIDALSKDPRYSAQVEMLKTFQDARDTKLPPAQVVARLKGVADKYPNYYPLQVKLVHAYIGMNQPNDAATIVERLMESRPNDADAAKLAVSVYRAAGRWRDMKRAADRWRQRTLERPTDADIALAEAMLQLDEIKAASDQLAPYIDGVKDQPMRTPALTAVVARLLVATGKTGESKAILQPLLNQGASWRRLWLSLAGGSITPAETASEWIRIATVSVPDGSFDEQFRVASAWQQLGVRLKDKPAIESARDLLRTLVEQKEAPVSPMLMLASLDTDAGDFTSAEALYRRILKTSPDEPNALNNLAYLLLQRGGDLNEAKDLATRAIGITGTIAAFHDTLARIHEKLDDPAQAQREFEEALRLDPASLDARIGLGRVLSSNGKRDKATQELQRIETQLNGAAPNSESTRRELQSLRERLTSSAE